MSTPFPLRQEPDRVPARRLYALAGGALVIAALGVASSSWLAASGHTPHPAPQPQRALSLEHSLIEGATRGQALRQAQRARLESYGWVDPKAGTVHIPIERAMQLSIEQSR